MMHHHHHHHQHFFDTIVVGSLQGAYVKMNCANSVNTAPPSQRLLSKLEKFAKWKTKLIKFHKNVQIYDQDYNHHDHHLFTAQ